MYLLSDILTYIRRLIKTPNNASVPDNLLIDYINRFWLNDVDARLQLFDLKTKYQFVTTPGVDQYNMPMYSVQRPAGSTIDFYPVYQGFTTPCYINGIDVPLQTQKDAFYSIWPNVIQQFPAIATGNDQNNFLYTIQIPLLPSTSPQNPPFNPILRGHIDINGIVTIGNALSQDVPADPPIFASFPPFPLNPNQINIPTTSIDAKVFITTINSVGKNVVITDSGAFLTSNNNLGLLLNQGPAPYGNTILPIAYSATRNVVNYQTGTIYVTI